MNRAIIFFTFVLLLGCDRTDDTAVGSTGCGGPLSGSLDRSTPGSDTFDFVAVNSNPNASIAFVLLAPFGSSELENNDILNDETTVPPCERFIVVLNCDDFPGQQRVTFRFSGGGDDIEEPVQFSCGVQNTFTADP